MQVHRKVEGSGSQCLQLPCSPDVFAMLNRHDEIPEPCLAHCISRLPIAGLEMVGRDLQTAQRILSFYEFQFDLKDATWLAVVAAVRAMCSISLSYHLHSSLIGLVRKARACVAVTSSYCQPTRSTSSTSSPPIQRRNPPPPRPPCKCPTMSPFANHTHTAFFYGTLMAPAVLKRVTSHDPASTTSPLTTRPALLPGHRRHRVKGADYPAVVPLQDGITPMDKAALVRGTVVQGLTREDMWRLDLFEGDEYARRKVIVIVDMDVEVKEGAPMDTLRHAQEDGITEQEELEAETYIWIAGQHRLEDTEWDFDEFVREKMWRWAPEEETGGREDAVREVGEDEDEGFEDVRRAVEDKRQGEQQVDPTGGRLVGGSFEDAVRQSRGEGSLEGIVRSAV